MKRLAMPAPVVVLPRVPNWRLVQYLKFQDLRRNPERAAAVEREIQARKSARVWMERRAA